jgi:hypothetical protein
MDHDNGNPQSSKVPSPIPGKGELLTDPHHYRDDLRMIGQALKGEWEIPEEAFKNVPRVVYLLAMGRDPSGGDDPVPSTVRMRAAQVLEKMNSANQRLEPQRHIVAHTVLKTPEERQADLVRAIDDEMKRRSNGQGTMAAGNGD